MKNLPRSLHVWRWTGGEPITASQTASKSDERPAVAVLAFTDPSGDAEQRHFADGLTEDLVAAISHANRFPVISAESSASLSHGERAQDEIARLLGARYLVSGTVRRAAGRLRVTVRLDDADSRRTLWSERYDRPVEDVFDVQDEIVLRVVSALEPELLDHEIRRLRSRRPDELGAWERFLRGMMLLRIHDEERLAAARTEFEAALAIDPEYGEAWSALAWTWLKEFGGRKGADPEASLEAGFEAARKGVSFDDGSAFAHYVMSTAYVWKEETALSLAELEHALALNPFYVRARMARGNRLELATDRAEEGIEEMRRALALSPRDPDRYWYFAAISRALVVAGRHAEALDWIERALGVRPEDPNLLHRRAICLAQLDRPEDARADLDACERLKPGFVASRREWRPYTDAARNEAFFAGLKRHRLGGWS